MLQMLLNLSQKPSKRRIRIIAIALTRIRWQSTTTSIFHAPVYIKARRGGGESQVEGGTGGFAADGCFVGAVGIEGRIQVNEVDSFSVESASVNFYSSGCMPSLLV